MKDMEILRLRAAVVKYIISKYTITDIFDSMLSL